MNDLWKIKPYISSWISMLLTINVFGFWILTWWNVFHVLCLGFNFSSGSNYTVKILSQQDAFTSSGLVEAFRSFSSATESDRQMFPSVFRKSCFIYHLTILLSWSFLLYCCGCLLNWRTLACALIVYLSETRCVAMFVVIIVTIVCLSDCRRWSSCSIIDIHLSCVDVP